VESKRHSEVLNLLRVLDVYEAKEESMLSGLVCGNKLGKE